MIECLERFYEKPQKLKGLGLSIFIQELVPRCMLFTYDMVLLEDPNENLNERLKSWRRVLETHSFCLSMSKIEWKFNKRKSVSNIQMKAEDPIIP